MLVTDLKTIQEKAFCILEEVDRICKENNIEYFLCSGTLLGAVRHKGFIPWDDDIDLVMTRESFKCFKKACKIQLNPKFRLYGPKERGEEYFDFIEHVEMIDYEWCAEDVALELGNVSSKISLDIFFLDHAPDQKWLRTWQCFQLILIQLMSIGHRKNINYNRYKIPQRPVIFVLSSIGRRLPMSWLRKRFSKIATKYNNKKTIGVRPYGSAMSGVKLIFPTKIYSDSVEMLFEEKMFPVPKQWDEYLRICYGDYMKLPPKEKRIPEHARTEINSMRFNYT